MEPILEIKNLCKQYPDFSLDHVNFTLPKGCIMGFIGENGAGKTTTIKALLGLIHPDAGEIRLFGAPLGENPQQKAEIGVVLDETTFHDSLRLKDIHLILKNIYPNWDRELFFQYARRFALPENSTVKTYSKGMKMKLNLIAALAHHPKLLVLDEPTSGLDPVVREEFLDLFLEFIQDEEHSILISSHITSDLEKAADYITFIHHGEILLSENKDELLSNMGILRCGKGEAEFFKANQFLRRRQNQFGLELLLKDRFRFQKQYPELTVDPATLEDIMLFYVRGEKV